MEREVLGKVVQAEKSLERRGLHARGVSKTHVVVDEREYLVCLFVGEAKAPADLGTDGDAYFNVSVKTNAVGRCALGRGLADVVEKGAPG
jgi:hypothetical protein